MVKMMVGFLALLLSAHGVAAVTAKLDRVTSTLGEPLVLSVSGPAEALERLDTQPLEQDFLVHASTLSRSGGQADLSLTLYPKHTGRLTVPALISAAGHTRAQPVSVANGSDETAKVILSVEMEPARPLARQPTRFTLEACDDGSLNWDRPILPTHEGFTLRPLGEQQLDRKRDDTTCTAHRWHWSLLPTAAGVVNPALPWLKAGKFGTQLRFPPPSAQLEVQPLPTWLPPEAAIGQPQIMTTSLPTSTPVERPVAWHMEITGGYAISDIKALLRLQLAAYPNLNHYPPTVEVMTSETPDDPHTRLAVTLYVLPTHTGPLALPDLLFPWYDPATGQLENLLIPGPHLTVFNPLYATLTRWGTGLTVSALLTLAAWRLRRTLAWRLHRRRGLNAIRRATDLSALHRAVRSFSLSSDQEPATTLGQWRDTRRMTCTGLPELIANLEQASYGDVETDLAQLRYQAIACLSKARPDLR